MDAIFNRTIRTNNKWIEYQPQSFFWQPRAVIADLDLNFLLIRGGAIHQAGANTDHAAWRQARDFVFEQKLEKAVKLGFVDAERRKRIVHAILYSQIFGCKSGFQFF